MLSTKKAQGMSLNTVIIAIIVLVVLVVLIMIFTGYFSRIFTPTVQSCETTLSGKCRVLACADDEATIAKYDGDTAAAKAGCSTGIRFCCKPKLGAGF